MNSAGALNDPRLTAVGLLMEVHQGLLTKFVPRLSEHGLSENEFEILLRLGRTPGGRLRMSDLAAQTTLTTSGVTRVVDRLERASMVVRASCATDRRGTWAQITEAGVNRISAAVTDHVEDIEHWFTGRLSVGQLKALTEALRLVRDAVRPDALAGVEAAQRA